MCIYGYIRVSSKDQNPDRQLASMEEYDVDKTSIYIDKVSRKYFYRP